VAIPRKAAEPGIVEKIASFLGDNGYTRAWNDAATAAVTPVDRLLASDEDRLAGVAAGVGPMLARLHESWMGEHSLSDLEGTPNSYFGDGLRKIDPSGALFEAYDRPVREPTEEDQYPPLAHMAAYARARVLSEKTGEPLGHLLGASVLQSAQKYGYDTESVKRYSQQGGLPEKYLMTRGGQYLRTAIGSPVVAYGLPAAGIGLAGWGIHDAMAAQQQAEKDSQLPLQGGVR